MPHGARMALRRPAAGDWCGFSLPGQKRHHGGRVAAAPLPVKAAPPSPLEDDDTEAYAAVAVTPSLLPRRRVS